MSLPLLVALLLAPSSAQADDLQLEFTLFSPEGQTHRSVTFHDVVGGPQPGMVVSTPAGERYRVDLNLEIRVPEDPALTTQVMYEVELLEIEQRRNGKEQAEVISRPRIIANIDQPASIETGNRMEDGDGGYVTISGFRLDLLYLTTVD